MKKKIQKIVYEDTYDWFDLEGMVSEMSGYDLRCWPTVHTDSDDNNDDDDDNYHGDFWIYAIDHIFYGIDNGCRREFCPTDALNEIKDKDLGKNNFVKEILQFFVRLFEEQGLGESIFVEISW
jgi:hypothetical protein